jgi:2'-5' RNA ligase
MQKQEKPGPRRSLTAAAMPVNLTSKTEARRMRVLRQGWQSDAASYVDAVAELSFAFRFLGHASSRMRYFPACVNPEEPDGPPIAIEEVPGIPQSVVDTAHQAMNALGIGRQALAPMQKSLSWQLGTTGECYLVGQQDPQDGDKEWTIRSIDEFMIFDDTYKLREVPLDPQGTLGWVPLDPATTYVARLWNPWERYQKLATSPMRALLDVAEELLLLSRDVRSTARSRLAGGGILKIPEGLRMAPINEDDDDPESEAWFGRFAEAMMTPISDDGVASAVVPIGISGDPESLAQLDHLIIDRPYSALALELRAEAIGRIATGLDFPREILEGIGDVNHFSAALVSDETFRHHIEPQVITQVDCMSGGYLRVWLTAAGIPKYWVDRICVWYDPVDLISKPDPMANAVLLHDRFAISNKALRESGGFKESDQPGALEIEFRMLQKTRTFPPNMVEAIFHKVDPELAFPPINTSGTIPGIGPQGEIPAEAPQPALPASPPPPASPAPALPPEASATPPSLTARRFAGAPDPDEVPTGVMVALMVPPTDAQTLAVDGGEPPDELHVTLAFLGQAVDMTSEQQQMLNNVVATWCSGQSPFDTTVGATSNDFGSPDEPCTVALIDAPTLPGPRQELIDAMHNVGIQEATNHGWIPHLTLAYGEELDVTAPKGYEIHFSNVVLAVGADRSVIPLGTKASTDPKPPSLTAPVEAFATPGANPTHVRLSRKLTEIDSQLRARIQVAACAAMTRLLDKAGAKLRTRSADRKFKNAEISTLVASQSDNRLLASTLGPTLVASLGFTTAPELLSADWSELKAQFTGWTEAAQKQALRVAMQLAGISSDDESYQTADAALQSSVAPAWDAMESALNAIAEKVLYTPDGDLDGGASFDPDTVVPAGVVRNALTIAGGVPPTDAVVDVGQPVDVGTDPAGAMVSVNVPGGQIGNGDAISGLLDDSGMQVVTYEWIHGSGGQHPLPCHDYLDGVPFASFDDDVLSPDNNPDWDGFPEVERLAPGDHDGCTCLPGETMVSAVDLLGATRRWYDGELITIVTGQGQSVSGTPNHPVLTTKGWVGLGDLYLGSLVAVGESADAERVEASFGRLAQNDVVMSAPCGSGDFHGDGGHGDMDIVGRWEQGVDADIIDPLFSAIGSITVSQFTGYVYNLHTKTGRYTAGGIVVHNCDFASIYGPGDNGPDVRPDQGPQAPDDEGGSEPVSPDAGGDE